MYLCISQSTALEGRSLAGLYYHRSALRDPWNHLQGNNLTQIVFFDHWTWENSFVFCNILNKRKGEFWLQRRVNRFRSLSLPSFIHFRKSKLKSGCLENEAITVRLYTQQKCMNALSFTCRAWKVIVVSGKYNTL